MCCSPGIVWCGVGVVWWVRDVGGVGVVGFVPLVALSTDVLVVDQTTLVGIGQVSEKS